MTAVPVVLVLAPTVAHAAEPDLAGARLWTSDRDHVPLELHARRSGPATRFILRPTCDVGPCDTAVRITYVAPAPHGTLAWDGDRYTAELIDGSPVACEGVSDPTAVVVLDLQVTRADVVGGEWRATRITGTMEVTTSGFRSCGAGGWTAGVTGTLR